MIRILHLSDIQYGRHHADRDQRPPLYPDRNYSAQLTRLIDDLEILKAHEGLVPNFIVVTGDIAERSLRKEYEAAASFLGELAAYLKIDRRYVVMVPGNHDVNRKLCRAERLTAEAYGKSFQPPYFRKFEFYKAFFDGFYEEVVFPAGVVPYTFTEERLFVNYFFPAEGIVFTGLNSCIDESEEAPHYGNITVDQLKAALREVESHDPGTSLRRVALMHHNFVRSSEVDDENLRDADELKPLLSDHHVELILHGHQHVPKEEVTGSGQHVMHVLATGSAGLDGHALPETARRYQVIELDGPTVRVYRRFFDNTHVGRSGKGCWKTDRAPAQKEAFDSFTIAGWAAERTGQAAAESGDACHWPARLVIPDAYREWALEACGHMDVDKLRDKGSAIRVRLPELYIPLHANPPGKAESDGGRDLEMVMAHRTRGVDVEDLIAGEEDLLISGEAGCGKTTLLKHFVYMVLTEPGWKELNDLLPVLIFLKDLRDFDFGRGNQDCETAEKMLAHGFSRSGCGLDVETVKAYCGAGKALFLLDGLDEIPLALRNLVVKALSAFRRDCRGGRFVYAGRPHGLEGAVVDFAGERRVSVLPLAMDQMEMFIKRWFQQVEQSASKEVQKTAEAMISEIKVHPGVARLIQNPLMLTAVCILYYDERELPGQRAELYQKFVDNMLHRRFDEPEPVYHFLMSLAHHMHGVRVKGIDEVEALKVLGGVLHRGERSGENHAASVRMTFDHIEPNCGLLKFDGGELMFRHLTLQEFLSAAYLRDNETRYDDAVRGFWRDEWYREVIEMLVGLLSMNSRKWAHRIVSDALERADEAPFHRWRLAARSLLDIHADRRYDDVVDLATEKLRGIMASEADVKARADAGETLGWLGDRRDLEAFVRIPDGVYKTSVGKVRLAGFEMGTYPVTNQWFRKFVEQGGYGEKAYWSPEGLKWLAHTGAEYPYTWHDREWNCPNHPVVGVCWYEADAFCRWLTISREDGYRYGLPTEQEWEATAAGKKRLEYPWGPKFDETLCNVKETGIGSTSSVGIFARGNSQQGLSDLAGNVWEWTVTSYNNKKELADFRFETDAQNLYGQIISSFGDGRNKLIESYAELLNERKRQVPVFRGGAWDFDGNYARCDNRIRSHPNDRGGDIGFRCSRTKI